MNHFGSRGGGGGSVNSYIYEVKNRINSADGDSLADLLSLERFEPGRDLQHAIGNGNQWENAVNKVLDSPWDELVRGHLLAYQALLYNSEDYSGAFGHKCSMVPALVKVLTQIKEENWMLPIVYVTSTELRKLAICADTRGHTSHQSNKAIKPNANVEEAASQLMNVFRVCATDSRTAIEISKRKAMMNIINQLFKIYFRINKLNLYKPLVRALENANIMDQFSLAERVTYSYFTGLKSLYDSDYLKADNQLTFAFDNCHREYLKNRRIILIFLIPVKMLFSGCMPTKQLLAEYQLEQFEDLCEAIKDGNLYSFDQAIEKHSDFFYCYGIYFTLEKLKALVYRNIFKKVAKIVNTHQISMNHFVKAINYFQSNRGQIELAEEDKVTCEEVHCLLANLIAENKLKGYISLQHQKLVISKQNPFPKLSSINQ